MSERKERGMLFCAEMVRKLLHGTKTQTRRLVKPQPHPDFGTTIECCFYHPHRVNKKTGEAYPEKEVFGFWSEDADWPCPYGKVGDIIYCKETFYDSHLESKRHPWTYRADLSVDDDLSRDFKWKPSIFMPRAASRIDLEIVAIKVERLQDISEADAVAEGIEILSTSDEYALNGIKTGKVKKNYKFYGKELERLKQQTANPVWSFQSLWESINGTGSWALNPWVWKIEFRRIKP